MTRPSGYEWRYLAAGHVVHALDGVNDPDSICGFHAWWGDTWLGTGSQDEYDRAASLPECRRCLRKIGATR